MKPLILLVVVQAAFLLVNGSPTYDLPGTDFPNELGDSDVLERDSSTAGSSRSGRVIASYSQQLAQNTAVALEKFTGVSQSIGNVSLNIGELTTYVNQTNTEILSKMDQVGKSLKAGSDIVSALDNAGNTLNVILGALTNSTDPHSLPGKAKKIADLLETKFSVIEKILGYESI